MDLSFDLIINALIAGLLLGGFYAAAESAFLLTPLSGPQWVPSFLECAPIFLATPAWYMN